MQHYGDLPTSVSTKKTWW